MHTSTFQDPISSGKTDWLRCSQRSEKQNGKLRNKRCTTRVSARRTRYREFAFGLHKIDTLMFKLSFSLFRSFGACALFEPTESLPVPALTRSFRLLELAEGVTGHSSTILHAGFTIYAFSLPSSCRFFVCCVFVREFVFAHQRAAC